MNILKRYITGLRKVKTLKITQGHFTIKETGGTKNKMILFGFWHSKGAHRFRHKIPSIDFCDRSSVADASVAKSFFVDVSYAGGETFQKRCRYNRMHTLSYNFHNVVALFQMTS